jgi:hypothetical protein
VQQVYVFSYILSMKKDFLGDLIESFGAQRILPTKNGWKQKFCIPITKTIR